MSPLTPIVRGHPFLVFAALACLFGWSNYIAAWFGLGSNPDNMPLGPLLAALVVTSLQGRDALRSYWHRLRDWRAAPLWYATAVLTPVVVHVGIVVINNWFGAPLPTGAQLAHWPDIVAAFVLMLVAVGVGEEAGWTAFAAPLLLRRHGLVAAWAMLASVRILWHVPLMVNGEMPWLMGILGNAGFQLALLLMFRASGSWAPAAVWHATLNAFGGAFFFTMVTGADKDRLGLLLGILYAVLAAAALAWTWRRRPELLRPTALAPDRYVTVG
jgi:membrane protease YdiL (CAAX protease family)